MRRSARLAIIRLDASATATSPLPGRALTRPTLGKAIGAARWAGLLGGRVTLGGQVVVVSPHLDDGVFSLGAAIACAARTGADVTILTVLAGDPASAIPAGDWDRRAGFETAGQAARTRRVEDARASELLGAKPIWLPFSDNQYPRGGSDTAVRAAVVEAAGDAQVILPGFPLVHEDHLWLRRLLDGAFPEHRTLIYAEQPYAAASGQERAAPLTWRPLRASLRDRKRKVQACRAYHSQLRLLGDRVVSNIMRYEMRVGGETVAGTMPR